MFDNESYFVEYFSALARKGGPEETEYIGLHEVISRLHGEVAGGRMSPEDLTRVRRACGPVFESTGSLFGHAYLKPYGYAGDFEVIDRMHTVEISTDPVLERWDRFAQSYPAFRAVRNRKGVLCRVLGEVERRAGRREVRVLNVASGPARDVREYFRANPGSMISMECIDSEPKAIEHARSVCRDHLDRVSFRCASILDFAIEGRYDLIWSAGLFDYFSDATFAYLLEEFLQSLTDGGEVFIGNLSMSPSFLSYIEFLDWRVYLRSEADLRRLAAEVGASAGQTSVEREPEGVNLFLRVSG